mgnify:CR=1 FL=1
MTSYIVILEVKQDVQLTISSKTYTLARGRYIYIGSANLWRPYLRLHRHMIKRKKVKWHIDYLTINPNVNVQYGVLCYNMSESSLYIILIKLFKPVIKGFGCTDRKKHVSHLFESHPQYFNELIDILIRKCNDVEFVL